VLFTFLLLDTLLFNNDIKLIIFKFYDMNSIYSILQDKWLREKRKQKYLMNKGIFITTKKEKWWLRATELSFCNWSDGHSWYPQLPSSTTHSISPSSSHAPQLSQFFRWPECPFWGIWVTVVLNGWVGVILHSPHPGHDNEEIL
jgi:hypothetical protein